MRTGILLIRLFAAVIAILLVTSLALTIVFSPPDNSQYDYPEAPLVMPAEEVSEEYKQFLGTIAEFQSQASTNIAIQRQAYEDFLFEETEGTFIPTNAGGVPGDWTIAENSDPDCRLLFVHGGGFSAGSARAYRLFTSEIARASACSVLAIDYRLIPENQVVNANTDTRTAYRWLMENGPEGPSPVESMFIAGDSAGGTLSLATIAWARDNSIRPVEGAIAISPMTDAHFETPTIRSNIETDPVNGPALGPIMRLPRFIFATINRTQTGKPLTDPEISPLLGDLQELPPTLITASHGEMLYGDSLRYFNKASEQGSPVELLVWPIGAHIMPVMGKDVPEAIDARMRIAQFIRSHK
ncbi:MAG: alpha/beta hydrolase [Pseudomonadales bacterium]|nr:alpha/beta hydrolase [Pseudomonadales bacterium]